MHQQTDASIGGLVRSALDDVRELVREELALARSELKQEASKATSAAIQFSIAGVTLLLAITAFTIALALGISALFDWPSWAGFAVVATLLAVVGAAMAAGGRKTVRTVRPLPRTVHTLKENFR
jgi:uncharacterized membrane protein YqjE